MRLGAGASFVGLIAVGVATYAAYQSQPVAECREIVAHMEEAHSASIPFPVTWSLPDKVACVFAPESQRETWLSSIEVYQVNAAQLQELSQPKP